MSGFPAYQGLAARLLLHSSSARLRMGASKLKESLMMRALIAVVLSAFVALPAAALAKPSLRDVQEIEDQLFAVAVA